MKKTLWAVIAILSILPFISQAQWTPGVSGNYYLTSGYASIGTNTPLGNFHVHTSTNQNLLARGNASLSSGISLYSVNDANTAAEPMEFGASHFMFSGGSFGINTATPLGTFDTKLATNQHIQFVPNVNGAYSGASGIVCINDANTAYTPMGFYASNYYFGGGNVGIATTSPIGNLDVRGNAFVGTADLAIGSTGSFIQVDQGASTGNTYSRIRAYSNGGTVVNNLVLQSSGGKVGIGTTTPDELLSVKGIIHSQEVKVDMTGWSDYVFKPKYKLPTLASVKSYIEKYQHLPGIPAEGEIVKDGLKVGEMNALLMRKVEELTLYLIEKDKREGDLGRALRRQERQINGLKGQLANRRR